MADENVAVPHFGPERHLARSNGSPENQWNGVYTPFIGNERVKILVDVLASVIGTISIFEIEIDNSGSLWLKLRDQVEPSSQSGYFDTTGDGWVELMENIYD